MSLPVVSVLLPVHNGERYLRQALDSLATQTFTDFEVVVVNDGSTDSTHAILAEYEAHDPRFRVYTQQRRGRVASLNTALERSSAPLVARMDADDIAIANRFELQVREFREQPDLGVLGGEALVIDEQGKMLGALRYPTTDRAIRSALERSSAFCHPATMMRRLTLTQVGGYRHPFRHAEDYDLWLRLAEVSRMANLSSPVLYYRWHTAQESAVQFEAMMTESIAARIAGRLRASGEPDPLLGAQTISIETLNAMGVDRAQLATELLSEIATRATVLVSFGQQEQALALLDRTLESSSLRAVPSSVRAHVELAYARARFGQGAVAKSAASLVRAGVADPVFVTKAALRGARSVIHQRAGGDRWSRP